MIVKVQRAIVPPDGPALIYDRERSFHCHAPMSPELSEMLDGDLKAYFEADLVGDQVVVGDRVEDQDW